MALEPDLVQEVLGAWVLAQRREPGEVLVPLGEVERALLAQMPWPLRRGEWLAGRRVAKRLMQHALGLDPLRTQVLPLESGAPFVSFDGVQRTDLVLNLSHTKGWAVAAVANGRVGIDVCDDVDGDRIARIARRVFSDGEADRVAPSRAARRRPRCGRSRKQASSSSSVASSIPARAPFGWLRSPRPASWPHRPCGWRCSGSPMQRWRSRATRAEESRAEARNWTGYDPVPPCGA